MGSSSCGVITAVLGVVRLHRNRGQHPADDQFGERGRNLTVGLKVGLDVLTHRERNVGMSDPLAKGLPVDLGVSAGRGILWRTSWRSIRGRPARSASRLNRRVIVSGCCGLPSSQQNSRP
jgi:hypothetical protein